MNKLYIDLDGVLCDFDAQCRTFFNDLDDTETVTAYKTRIGGNQFWRQIRATDGEFWSTMPPMDTNIVGVWDRLKTICPHIAILSSPDDRDPKCIPGKNQWLDKHLGREHYIRIFESDKFKYACPRSVLVDDLTKNTVAWELHGGTPVLFNEGAFTDTFWQKLTTLFA